MVELQAEMEFLEAEFFVAGRFALDDGRLEYLRHGLAGRAGDVDCGRVGSLGGDARCGDAGLNPPIHASSGLWVGCLRWLFTLRQGAKRILDLIQLEEFLHRPDAPLGQGYVVIYKRLVFLAGLSGQNDRDTRICLGDRNEISESLSFHHRFRRPYEFPVRIVRVLGKTCLYSPRIFREVLPGRISSLIYLSFRLGFDRLVVLELRVESRDAACRGLLDRPDCRDIDAGAMRQGNRGTTLHEVGEYRHAVCRHL